MHTPGPWTADGLRVWAGSDTEPVYIASLKFQADSQVDEEEREGNTRLIAAAPELLAALQQLAEWARIMGDWDARAWDNARAAIAKATA